MLTACLASEDIAVAAVLLAFFAFAAFAIWMS